MEKYFDRNGTEIKLGNKVEYDPPVAYIGGKFSEPMIGLIIEENGELIHDDGKYKTPIKYIKSFSLKVL